MHKKKQTTVNSVILQQSVEKSTMSKLDSTKYLVIKQGLFCQKVNQFNEVSTHKIYTKMVKNGQKWSKNGENSDFLPKIRSKIVFFCVSYTYIYMVYLYRL